MSGVDGSKVLITKETDQSGKVVFNNVVKDYYTVRFPGDDEYLPGKKTFILQLEKDKSVKLAIMKRSSGNTILE